MKMGRKRKTTIACPYCNQLRAAHAGIHNGNHVLCTSPDCKKEVLNDSTVIPEVIVQDYEHLNVYKEHFPAISRGLRVLGRIQTIYNVRLIHPEGNDVREIEEVLRTIHSNQVSDYRLGVSIGRLLECTENGKRRVEYFHASVNNSSVFYTPDTSQNYIQISTEQDIERAIEILKDNIGEDTKRPDTR